MRKQMFTLSVVVAFSCVFAQTTFADQNVTDIRVSHRHGQTFVTWKDVAEGEAGASVRYSLYCSERPITEQALPDLKPAIDGIPNNSGKHYGYHMSIRVTLGRWHSPMNLPKMK